MMNDKLTKRLLVSLIVLVFTAAPASAQNLVVDGSFEGISGGVGWQNVAASGETFGAWTSHIDNFWVHIGSTEGQIDGTTIAHIGDNLGEGSISQVVTGFQIGGTYEVSIAAIEYITSADHPGGTLTVTNEGTATDDLNVTIATPNFAVAGGIMEYSSFQFVASNTQLKLDIFNPGGFAMNVDDVSVVAVAPLQILHSEGQALVREEGQTTDSFTLVLTEAPSAAVTVTLDPNTDDIGLNGAEPNDSVTLTFSTGDWNVPQTVTVMANDDDLAEGLEDVPIAITGASDDIDFVFATGTSATVVDNDSAGLTVAESDGSTELVEGGDTDSYTIVLTFAPTSDVTVTIDDAGDPNQTTVDGGKTSTLTFTPSNWDTPQAVTVEAINDETAEADPHVTPLTHSVSQPGGDQAYDGLDVDDVSVSVGENDCGFGPFAGSDVNEDCITNLLDFAIVAAEYLICSISVCE